MKNRRVFRSVFLIAALGIAISVGAADTVKAIIPESELMAALARDFPSWEGARCGHSVDIENCLDVIDPSRGYKGSSDGALVKKPLSLVICRVDGDFDGDGVPDAAVQLKRKDSNYPRWIVVVVFQRQGELNPVYAGEGGPTIGLLKKGAPGYDYDTGKNFIYENDAILVGWGMGGSSLVFRGGQFHYLSISD